MISARRVLGFSVLLVAVGFASIVYFERGYDTWGRTEVAPPSDSAYAHDMTEAVFYQDEDRMERARIGRRTGIAILGVGLFVPASALGAVRRSQRVPASFSDP